MPDDVKVYKNAYQAFEHRVEAFLAAVTAADDEDGPAQRRDFLYRAPDGPNPRPARLDADTPDLPSWLTSPEAQPRRPAAYGYLEAEDINLALARLYSGGRSSLPDVVPRYERRRPDSGPPAASPSPGNTLRPSLKDWQVIDDQLRQFPTLTEPVGTAMLLGIVQLLHQNLWRFLNDAVLRSAFVSATEGQALDDERAAFCYRVTGDLYERWSGAGSAETERTMLAARVGEFALPDAVALPFNSPPRMTADESARYADGLSLLTRDTGDALIERCHALTVDGVLTIAIIDAFEWLALFARLRTTPLGEALRLIAEKLHHDVRYARMHEDDFSAVTDTAFLAEIPRNPFVWSVRTQAPKTLLPRDFPFPPFTAEGVYWWRVLFSHCVTHILSLRDTSDFHATDLLRFSYRLRIYEDGGREVVPEFVRALIRSTLLHFKYWYDEAPSADSNPDQGPDPEMCFWSENHQLMFAQSEYLAGNLFPDAVFRRVVATSSAPGDFLIPGGMPVGLPNVPPMPGLTGEARRDRGRRRLEHWLDNRLRFGFGEWNAPGYYNEDINPLLNLVDAAPDAVIRDKAAMVMDLVMFDIARFTCGGSFAVSAGRVYGNHKLVGWEQSIGDLIELAFGTRGDYIQTRQNCAISLATSDYRIPDAILRIGLDRIHADRANDAVPFVDRSRVSVLPTFEADAPTPDTPEGLLFWWAAGNYVTHEMRDATKRIVDAHPNLSATEPFHVLFPDGGLVATLGKLLLAIAKVPGLSAVLESGVGAGLQRAGWHGAALLPFPLNIVSWGAGAAGSVLVLKSLTKLFYTIVSIAKRVFDWALAWTGLTDTHDELGIPESDLIEFYHSLIDVYNRGSVLQRANLYTYSNGHAMLSSAQCHQPGAIAAQKQPWMATLGCDVSVFTTCPWPERTLEETILRAATIGNLQESAAALYDNLLEPYRALFALARPALPNFMGVGPDDWTGSFALPMVIQHEHVAVIMYSMPLESRASEDNGTHAWFPTPLFDEVIGPMKAWDDGTWMFGRKGAGFIALFSAQEAEWEQESHRSLWASGARNVWICVVDRADDTHAPQREFASFRSAALSSRPEIHHLNGANALGDLRGQLRVPRYRAYPNTWPRFMFNYEQVEASVDGRPLTLDEFPRFENRYVSVDSEPPPRGGIGTVPWGARRYVIHHPPTGAWVSHDHLAARRASSDDDVFLQSRFVRRGLPLDRRARPVSRSRRRRFDA